MNIVAQMVGALAFLISLLAYHKKRKEKILGSMIVSNVLNLIHYFMLEAYSGCVTKIIAICRDIFIIVKSKYKKLNSIMFLILFILVYCIVAIVTYNNVLSLFPIIAALVYIISIWNGNEIVIKKTAFATYFLWLAYNIFVFSISGIVSNVVSIISTFIAIINYDKNKEENNKKVEDIDEEKISYNCKIARTLEKDINLIVIADTHGSIHFHRELLTNLIDKEYDLCCILGDVSDYDYEVILKCIPKEKIVALLGNHDRFELLEKYNLNNINGNTITINGIKIGGIQGSHKYKNEEYPMYTHEESIEFLDRMEEVDILLSHDKPFIRDTGDNVHDGLKGITKYLYDKQVPINIHGHIHDSNTTILKNGTISKGVYLCEYISIRNGKII